MNSKKIIFATVLFFLMLSPRVEAAAQFFAQQGGTLVGTGAVNDANGTRQGQSVAISADGNTAIVGGYLDNSGKGAAWIWSRSGTVWTQQGSKLVGTGAVGNANQGISVAISADGNTAIVGGSLDSNRAGAAWVWIRSGGVWTQQGSKLVGTGMVGDTAHQGVSVSLSADGNTAVVGGSSDDGAKGAVWVWTRLAGVWTQQGGKLVGTGAEEGQGGAGQGSSVSLSGDGNTLLVGAALDGNTDKGAAWVWTRSGNVWTQQGSKLVGTGGSGSANTNQGASVSLSADGNTAIVGGPNDGLSAGAAWIWTRSVGVWTQQGGKLAANDAGGLAVSFANQGISVSISTDGNVALVGGNTDSTGQVGAAWVWTRSGSTWTQRDKLKGAANISGSREGTSVSLSADGKTGIVGGPFSFGGVATFNGAAWIFAALPTPIPSLTSPANNSTNRPINDTLTWASVGATTYRVQLSTDPAFATIVVDDSTITGTSRAIGVLAYNTVYYWRVSATGVNGASAFSASQSFTTIVAAPAAPVLVSPLNNDTGITDLTDHLTWTASGATTYRVQLSTDSTFATTLINDSTVLNKFLVPQGVVVATVYYWRVNAKNVGGTSPFSSVWKFATNVRPSVPVLFSPADGSTGRPVSDTLSWGKPPGFPATYRVQLSTDSTFATTVINDSSLVSAVRATGVLAGGTAYYWRVNAKNIVGTSAFSSTSKFTTVGITSVPDAPTSVTGIAGNAQVAVSATPPVSNGGSSIIGYTVTASPGGASCTSTVASCTVTGLTNGTSYTFTMTATNSVGTGPASTVSSAVIPATVPGSPTGVTGAGGTSGQITVSWAAPSSTGGSVITGYTATTVQDTSKHCTTTGLTCAVTGLTNTTSYSFTVTASNAVGRSAVSAASSPVTGILSFPKDLGLRISGSSMKFLLPEFSGSMKISITDIWGREVWNKTVSAGTREVSWNRSSGQSVVGVYILRLVLQGDNFKSTLVTESKILLMP